MSGFARTMAVLCAAAVMCAAGAAPAGAAAGRRAPANQNCAEPGQEIGPVPWPQRMLGPERAWPFSKGGGTVVAVLGSGVDAGHPQFNGHVINGFDALANGGGAGDDCLGGGTQVAGVIAAQQRNSVGFVGVAPDARIIPIRVVDGAGFARNTVDPAVLARGIQAAVQRGAHIIAVPVVSYRDTAALRTAVEAARASGVLVLAAVGDEGNSPTGGGTPYPAAYEGVIGVGAIGEDGIRWANSQQGEYVDIVAPGAGVVTLQRDRGMTVVDGTGVACGFAAGVAALIRAKRPSMRGDEIARQLLATATAAAGGPAYGSGVVNPYAAVTERLVGGEPAPLPALERPSSETSPAWIRSRDVAIGGAALALVAVLAVLVVAVVLPRGRRRFWRSAVAPAPAQGQDEPDEPGPPLQLFSTKNP